MTKEQWQEKLIEDPRFDADWIDLVSTLLSTYSSEQLEEVGIPHLDDLVSIDIRMIHIINSLLKDDYSKLTTQLFAGCMYHSRPSLVNMFFAHSPTRL